jgi:hypothetical protein
MAMNDLLSKLGIISPDLSQYQDIASPMDTTEAAAGRIQKPISKQVLENPEDLDPADLAPATESMPSSKLVSAADQAKINAIPLPDALPYGKEEADAEDDSTDKKASSKAKDKLSSSEILDLYRSLMPAQKKYQQDLAGLSMLQGGNQIAQAFAMGSGGKIGDGSEGVKALQQAAAQPLSDIKSRLDMAKETQAAMSTSELSDPDSDVSKFAREQAANVMLRMSGKANDPEAKADILNRLSTMSALNLEKLGFKGISQPTHAFSKEDRFFINGHPAHFDPNQGVYIDSVTGKVADAKDVITSSVARKDALDDTYKYVSSQAPLMGQDPKTMRDGTPASLGLQQNSAKPSGDSGQQSVPTSDQPKEYILDDLNKAQIKNYDKIVVPSIKEVRENSTISALNKINTAATTMLAKMMPDPVTGKVDSGNLAAARAQFATMSTGGPATDSAMHEIQGAGGLINQMKQVLDSSANGEITPENIKFMTQAASKFSGAAKSAMLDATQPYVDQIKSAYPDMNLQDDNVRKMLGIQNMMRNRAIEANSSKQSKVPAGMVTIKGPSGQTVIMSKDNAGKYLKKPGYSLEGQ